MFYNSHSRLCVLWQENNSKGILVFAFLWLTALYCHLGRRAGASINCFPVQNTSVESIRNAIGSNGLGPFFPLHNGGPKEIVCLPIVWWPLYMLHSLIHIKSHLSDSALVNNWESLLSHSDPLSYWDQIKCENPVHEKGGETTFLESRLGELSWVLLQINEWEKRFL